MGGSKRGCGVVALKHLGGEGGWSTGRRGEEAYRSDAMGCSWVWKRGRVELPVGCLGV